MSEAPARLGPLVHRSVHHGAALWVIASLQFVLAMVVVQLMWAHAPSYSLRNDVISDLGNTACGPWPTSTSTVVCSPWHDVFNGSTIALGILLILGVLLVPTAFPPRTSRSAGLGLLALAGVGSIGVGVFPENVNLNVHLAVAALAFVAGNLGLIVLAFGMFRDTRWDGYRAYTLFSGLVGLIAFLLYVSKVYLALGVGGMERLIVAPLLLWTIVAGIHLLRVPTFAPSILPKISNG